MKWPRRVNYSLKTLVLQEPALSPLYNVYYWLDEITWQGVLIHPKEKAIGKDTELVIDGFQGSANTFAFKSFNRSQTRPVKVGHHTHAPAQIIKAIKLGIPVWLIIREPAGAVVSLSARWPYISVTQSLLSYIGFYTKLKPYASDCVISTFKQHTQHIDRVVQTVNARFGTQFDEIDLAKAQAEHEAFTTQRDRNNPEEAASLKVSKQERIKELATPKNSKLLVQANALYKTFEELAGKTVQL